MSKVYYTEQMKFEPVRAWVVLAGDAREVVSLHKSKSKAEREAIAMKIEQPNIEVTFTKCVVMPDFKIK